MNAASECVLALDQPPDFEPASPATMRRPAQQRKSERKKIDSVWKFARSASPFCPGKTCKTLYSLWRAIEQRKEAAAYLNCACAFKSRTIKANSRSFASSGNDL